METCCPFCGLFSQINWLWYVIAVVVAFVVGALWYSSLFAKAWVRVFKVEMPEKMQSGNMIFTMLMQLLVTALLGLVFFMMTGISVWLAVLVLIAFCGWQKANLKFRYVKWNEYFMAALIEAGYTFVAGLIFILFALA